MAKVLVIHQVGSVQARHGYFSGKWTHEIVEVGGSGAVVRYIARGVDCAARARGIVDGYCLARGAGDFAALAGGAS